MVAAGFSLRSIYSRTQAKARGYQKIRGLKSNKPTKSSMSTLEDIYVRLEKNKKRRKEINKMLKDELAHSSRYKEIVEEMKSLREEKKGIEQEVRAGNSDSAELEELKSEIQTDQELLADQALNMFVKNETVEIKDEYDQTWYPVFKVSFKKSN